MELKITVDQGFNLEKAICNYGFFMMSPNQWISSTKSLKRPLRLADRSSSVLVSISQPSCGNHGQLLVRVEHVDSLSAPDKQAIERQVVRMLRITQQDAEDVRKFHKMHFRAKETGFGRLFRSPDLFEDIVKTVLLCNTSWMRTLQMSRALCELQAEIHSPVEPTEAIIAQDAQFPKRKKDTIPDFFRKRKRGEAAAVAPNDTTPKPTGCCGNTANATTVESKPLGNFPSSRELASLTSDFLGTRCQLGYRANYIIKLAQMVEDHKLKLEEFENQTKFNKTSFQAAHKKLMKLEGIGPFSAANILMCIGYYRRIPIDSETINHLHEVHGSKNCKQATATATAKREVGKIYNKFSPYQCLAYWCEHVEYYEEKLGQKMSELSPSSYYQVSGSCLSPTQKKRGRTIHDMN